MKTQILSLVSRLVMIYIMVIFHSLLFGVGWGTLRGLLESEINPYG